MPHVAFRSSIAIAVLATSLGGCARNQNLLARGPTDQASVPAAILRQNAVYIQAHAEGDAGRVASLYDSLGSRLNPGGEIVQGRDAVRAAVRSMLATSGPIQVTLKTLDFWLYDGRAYETGMWTYSFTPVGRTQMRSGGRYLTIWMPERDGSWRIAVDIALPSAP